MGPRDMVAYAQMCGWTLARARPQATASRSPAISEGARRSSRAIAEFSQSYADQNDSDYALLTKAVDSGSSKSRPAS